jgi:signal transduction histidine kinase
VVDDVQDEPRFLGDEMLPATQSELVVPLRIGNRVIGTLDVQSKEKRAFGDQDIRVLQGLGDQVSIAIENARLYAQARALAVVEERNRLARDLHDSVAQSLYGLVAFAGAGSNLVATGDVEPLEAYLNRMEKTAQQALNEMRLLLYELRPPTLEQEGLVGALRTRLDAVEGRVGVQVELKVDESIQLSPRAEEVFYRVAQEALNNALKHSAASAVYVHLQRVDECIELSVVDNGVGFEVETARSAGRFGLVGMQERATEMGGLLTLHSAPGEGTTVCLRLKSQSLSRSVGEVSHER